MYKLSLSEDDMKAILFVGNRYGWSKAILDAGLDVGDNDIPEHVAWELKDGFESDEEGGHSIFPMLCGPLARKLFDFMEDIV